MGKHGANMSHQCHPTPQDAAVPMLQRLGLLGVESLPDLLGEEGKGMELKGTRTDLICYYVSYTSNHQFKTSRNANM